MKIEVILLTSKFFTVLHPRRDTLGAQLGQACTLNIMQIQKTTFRDILTKIFEKLCTLRHERAFFHSPAILKRIFELKNSEFSCEIKF